MSCTVCSLCELQVHCSYVRMSFLLTTNSQHAQFMWFMFLHVMQATKHGTLNNFVTQDSRRFHENKVLQN